VTGRITTPFDAFAELEVSIAILAEVTLGTLDDSAAEQVATNELCRLCRSSSALILLVFNCPSVCPSVPETSPAFNTVLHGL